MFVIVDMEIMFHTTFVGTFTICFQSFMFISYYHYTESCRDVILNIPQKDYLGQNYIFLKYQLPHKISAPYANLCSVVLPPQKFTRPPCWYCLWKV